MRENPGWTNPERGYPLCIGSVLIISRSLNLEKQIKAITALDNIISDNINDRNGISKSDEYASILSELICVISDSKSKMKFNPYLYKTFRSFTTHKKVIQISLSYVHQYILNQELKDLFFH